MDLPKEIAKLKKELGKVSKLFGVTEEKLANPRFLSSAPSDVVEKERGKLAEFEERIGKINKYLKDLEK